jgi:hypothetical protein
MENRLALLRLPPPEDLGIGNPAAAEPSAVDWAAFHGRLNRLGATCFHLERTGPNACRITCFLPTRQQGRNHRIEAQAANEAEAARLALAKAEEWASGQ